MAGDRLIAHRYRLEERLGAGGMGEVWRATDTELRRTVALKRSHTGDGGQIRREARIGAGLSHPNVVTVFDTVLDGDDRWLVMEYLPARGLDRVIRDDGPLPPDEVGRIGAQLAAALAAMHARGMVHRDVKPDNVLVAEDGTARLTDLDIARWTDATLTGGALIGGTAGYLAPEVADGDEAGPAADVFSLGATLFAAVEGVSPWGSGDGGPYAQVRRAATYAREPIRHAGRLTPILDALLARLPRQRPTAADAGRMLAGTPGLPGRPPAGRAGRRWAALVGTAAAVLLLVAGAQAGTPRAVSRTPAGAARAGGTGDPRTADPCALLVPAALRRFGKPRLDPDYGNFNHCSVIVELPGREHVVEVAAELRLPAEYPAVPPIRGRLGAVERADPTDNRCQRSITLPEENRVVIFAREVYEKPADLCAMADAAALAAYGVLVQGPVPRRAAPFPADSLARVDACRLLSGRDVAPTIGASADAEPDFAHWSCSWEHHDRDVTVGYGREWPLADSPDDDQRVISVNGRTALLSESDDDGAGCVVELAYRRYGPVASAEKGTPPYRDETVTVSVDDAAATSTKGLCPATLALARTVTSRLPAR